MKTEPTERLQKVLAHAGVASRRKAELFIQEGRVTVNGRVVTELGTRVDAAHDEIRVDGRRVQVVAAHTYLLLHKPRGVLSAMTDSRGRRCLGDLVTVPERVYPVGRLDVSSEGLVLLTDDGKLANLLTHPRHGHEKEYRVLVNGAPSEKTLEAWRRGVVLEGEQTAPAEVEVIRTIRGSALLRVVLHEGRKRQIRSVAALLGHPVRELVRVRLGPFRLANLEPGQWRQLSEAEMQQIAALKAGQKLTQAPRPRRARRPATPGARVRRRAGPGPDRRPPRRRSR